MQTCIHEKIRRKPTFLDTGARGTGVSKHRQLQPAAVCLDLLVNQSNETGPVSYVCAVGSLLMELSDK